MPLRRLAGLAGIIVATWMLWETVQPIALLRLTSTVLMILGGLVAAAALPGGAWLFAAGAAIFAVMTGAMMGSGADASLWSDEAVLAPFLLVISGVLVFRHRK